MLATVLHSMKGTPYIYQGEEIGMTNYPFSSIKDFDDIEAINMYQERTQNGYPQKEIMKSLCAKARDNARTPMQWNQNHAAGFTEGNPWYHVNPNYPEINAEMALEDNNSIFYYYQKLIQLRKEEEILVYGTFTLLLPEDKHIFAYSREWNEKKWLIVCNFYQESTTFSYSGKGKVILSNYPQEQMIALEQVQLRPYEAIIFEITLP